MATIMQNKRGPRDARGSKEGDYLKQRAQFLESVTKAEIDRYIEGAKPDKLIVRKRRYTPKILS